MTLAALTDLHTHAQTKGITTSFALNHGCALSLCFHDPEGNLLEILWASGIKTSTPISEPIDLNNLDRSAAELLEMIGVPARPEHPLE